jgi:hypothetical protein
MPLTMDITPTPATTMMDRASISVDIITLPAVSKTGKPGSEPGFFFVQEAAFIFETAYRACDGLWPALKIDQGAMFIEMQDRG